MACRLQTGITKDQHNHVQWTLRAFMVVLMSHILPLTLKPESSQRPWLIIRQKKMILYHRCLHLKIDLPFGFKTKPSTLFRCSDIRLQRLLQQTTRLPSKRHCGFRFHFESKSVNCVSVFRIIWNRAGMHTWLVPISQTSGILLLSVRSRVPRQESRQPWWTTRHQSPRIRQVRWHRGQTASSPGKVLMSWARWSRNGIRMMYSRLLGISVSIVRIEIGLTF